MSTTDRKPLSSDLYTEEYFLTACEGYDVYLQSEGRELSRRLRDAFAVAEVRAGMRLLDVGCGRGEIVSHCTRLGVDAFGMDYSEVATLMTRDAIAAHSDNLAGKQEGKAGVCRADAKQLPFCTGSFDRVLMFDIVEHLHPWELHQAILEAGRVLKADGLLIVHTAPNRWYDTYAYPWVRLVRRLLGQGAQYPANPRAITPVNQDVHVNEQDLLSMKRALGAAGFVAKVWLDSPPQNRQESMVMAMLRRVAFGVPPFRWFFEREVFAVGRKRP